MAILRSTGEITRLVRDHLYERTKPGAAWPEGLAAKVILADVNQIRGTATSTSALTRALRDLQKAGLVTKYTSALNNLYKWTPGQPVPDDYQVRNAPSYKPLPSTVSTQYPITINANTAPKGQTTVATDPDEEKRKILRKKLEDRMAEINGEKKQEEEALKIPMPKKNAAPGIKRSNGQVYQPRQLGDRSDVETLQMLRDKKIYPLLSGPPGTGKTVLVDAAFGTEPGNLFTITADENTNVDDFLGQWSPDGHGSYVWVDGPLILAMRQGGVLFIDDATLANPKVLAVVYPAMDGRGEVTVKSHIVNGTPDVVTAKEGFFVVAAHNPGVHGAILTDALASRFIAQIWVETDLELAASLGVTEKFLKLTKNLQTKRDKGGLGIWVPQLRELLAARDVSRLLGEKMAAANLLGVAPEDSQDDIAAEMATVFGEDISRLELGSQL